MRFKTELAYNTQQKLLLAKEEIIGNLKELIAQQQSKKAVSLVYNSVGYSLTSNLKPVAESATKQDMVPQSKVIDLANHYGAKIKLMSEESELLRGQLDDAKRG